MMTSKESAPGLKKGVSKKFQVADKCKHVKFTNECLIFTVKHVLVPKYVNSLLICHLFKITQIILQKQIRL